MDWIQALSIIATVVASAYYIHREIQMDIRAMNTRTDKLYEIFQIEIKTQSARTDKLYEMFIDLIKEVKK